MPSSGPSFIDINSADTETLVSRLQISTRLAQRIISLRPFFAAADLAKVWGLDAETLARILPLVTFQPDSVKPAEEPTPLSPESVTNQQTGKLR